MVNLKLTKSEVMDVLINLIVAIISQPIYMSNHHFVHFKYIQFCHLYLNKTGKKTKIKAFKKRNWLFYYYVINKWTSELKNDYQETLFLASFSYLFLDKFYLISPYKSYEKEISGYQGMRFN